MKNRRLFILLTAGLLAFTGAAVFQGKAAPGDRPARGQILQHIVKELELTPDQIDKIKAALRAQKETLVPLVKGLHESRTVLRNAIHEKTASEATVREAASKVAALESDLAVERMKLSAKISPILTEEQINKVKQFEAKADDAIFGILKRLGEVLDRND